MTKPTTLDTLDEAIRLLSFFKLIEENKPTLGKQLTDPIDLMLRHIDVRDLRDIAAALAIRDGLTLSQLGEAAGLKKETLRQAAKKGERVLSNPRLKDTYDFDARPVALRPLVRDLADGQPVVEYNLRMLSPKPDVIEPLRHAGITTIGELIQKTVVEVKELPGMDQIKLAELRQALVYYKLTLAGESLAQEALTLPIRSDIMDYITATRCKVLDIETVGDLVAHTAVELGKLAGITGTRLTRLRSDLNKYGLALKAD